MLCCLMFHYIRFVHLLVLGIPFVQCLSDGSDEVFVKKRCFLRRVPFVCFLSRVACLETSGCDDDGVIRGWYDSRNACNASDVMLSVEVLGASQQLSTVCRSGEQLHYRTKFLDRRDVT